MTIEAFVENGQIVLPSPLNLPDGTKVRVEPIEIGRERSGRTGGNAPTLYDRMKPVIGIADDLPSDASRNVDHYLYGHPKK
jgi:hypothetical protein